VVGLVCEAKLLTGGTGYPISRSNEEWIFMRCFFIFLYGAVCVFSITVSGLILCMRMFMCIL